MRYAHMIGSDVAAQVEPPYCLDKRGIVAASSAPTLQMPSSSTARGL